MKKGIGWSEVEAQCRVCAAHGIHHCPGFPSRPGAYTTDARRRKVDRQLLRQGPLHLGYANLQHNLVEPGDLEHIYDLFFPSVCLGRRHGL